MKKRTVLITIIIFIGIFGAAIFILHDMSFLIGRITNLKTSFTDEQEKIIAEKLDVDDRELSVEKMEYTHYKHKGKKVFQFRIYGKINSLDSIEKTYKLDKVLGGKDNNSNHIQKEYSHKKNGNKFCIAESFNNNATYDVYFRINEYDKELENIMKAK